MTISSGKAWANVVNFRPDQAMQVAPSQNIATNNNKKHTQNKNHTSTFENSTLEY